MILLGHKSRVLASCYIRNILIRLHVVNNVIDSEVICIIKSYIIITVVLAK